MHVIAYPVGEKCDFNLAVLDEVDKAGYLLGATYILGNNYFLKVKNFRIKRVHIERYVGRRHFTSLLSLPELFC